MILTVAVLAVFGVVFYQVGFSTLSNQLNTDLKKQGLTALHIAQQKAAHAALVSLDGGVPLRCVSPKAFKGAFSQFKRQAKLTGTSYQLNLFQFGCSSSIVTVELVTNLPQYVFQQLVQPIFNAINQPPGTSLATYCVTPTNQLAWHDGQRCSGVRIRMVAERARINAGAPGNKAAIVLFRSLEPLYATRSEIARILLLLLPLAALLATILGFVVALGVTRPLRLMTRQVRAIQGASGLRVRISPHDRHDEIGQLAAAFNGMMDRLQEVFEQQRRFVADASHEMRTPLTAIIGNSELLARELPKESEGRTALTMIRREAGRLSRLVNDLLTLAELDAGPQLIKAPVELDTLLLDVYAQAKHIDDRVRVRLGDVTPIIVIADADRLRQLLLNLIDNAIKYTPAGGTVTLSLDEEPGFARLCVADTGVGIPPDDLPHIFDRFYRADKARSGHAGAGLGLSICRWIVEAHGGHIRVESTVGVGTTVIVELPTKSESCRASPPEDSKRLLAE
jgi:signal transduction histidine kinase